MELSFCPSSYRGGHHFRTVCLVVFSFWEFLRVTLSDIFLVKGGIVGGYVPLFVPCGINCLGTHFLTFFVHLLFSW